MKKGGKKKNWLHLYFKGCICGTYIKIHQQQKNEDRREGKKN